MKLDLAAVSIKLQLIKATFTEVGQHDNSLDNLVSEHARFFFFF